MANTMFDKVVEMLQVKIQMPGVSFVIIFGTKTSLIIAHCCVTPFYRIFSWQHGLLLLNVMSKNKHLSEFDHCF